MSARIDSLIRLDLTALSITALSLAWLTVRRICSAHLALTVCLTRPHPWRAPRPKDQAMATKHVSRLALATLFALTTAAAVSEPQAPPGTAGQPRVGTAPVLDDRYPQ